MIPSWASLPKRIPGHDRNRVMIRRHFVEGLEVVKRFFADVNDQWAHGQIVLVTTGRWCRVDRRRRRD